MCCRRWERLSQGQERDCPVLNLITRTLAKGLKIKNMEISIQDKATRELGAFD